MLTALDRATIYSVLCIISFCALVLKTSEASLIPIVGVFASVIGIGIEMYRWQDEPEQEY